MKENVTRIKNNLDETEFGQCDELIKMRRINANMQMRGKNLLKSMIDKISID